MECPECKKTLKESGTRYSCDDCSKQFNVDFTCQVCGSVPEEMAACGSVGYFCNTCNKLRSRTEMNKEFQTLE